MKKIIVFFIASLFVSGSSFASADIKKKNWNGIEVVWLKREYLPTFDIIFYFADGALSDGKEKGTTQYTFSLMDSGTNRFTQKEIVDNLEFYGVQTSASVFHEYSTFSVSGLVKDLNPVMKKICHLFNDTVYPDVELNKYKAIDKSSILAMSNSHSQLASTVFREISLEGTPFQYPVSGKLKDIDKVNRKSLIDKRKYFVEKVKKRIYIAGPSSVLGLENVIAKDCDWKGSSEDFERKIEYKPKISHEKNVVHLVTVPNANQAQVRIGKFLNKSELGTNEENDLASSILGGGMSSLLFTRARIEKGLTYSISAFAGSQAEYGRTGISTFTKNETINQLLDVIKDTLSYVNAGNVKPEEVSFFKSSLSGSHPFKFEKAQAFLLQLMFLDHTKKSYDELFDYPANMNALTTENVIKRSKEIFNWDDETIIVLGDKKLKKELAKKYKVVEKDYKSFL